MHTEAYGATSGRWSQASVTVVTVPSPKAKTVAASGWWRRKERESEIATPKNAA